MLIKYKVVDHFQSIEDVTLDKQQGCLFRLLLLVSVASPSYIC